MHPICDYHMQTISMIAGAASDAQTTPAAPTAHTICRRTPAVVAIVIIGRRTLIDGNKPIGWRRFGFDDGYALGSSADPSVC